MLNLRIRQREDDKVQVEVSDIIARMNKRFKSQEQFEMQLHTICMDIATELGCNFDHIPETDTLLFDFVNVPVKQWYDEVNYNHG